MANDHRGRGIHAGKRTYDELSDTDLLSAIRKRDVSSVPSHYASSGFYEKDDHMREEAKKRNLL